MKHLFWIISLSAALFNFACNSESKKTNSTDKQDSLSISAVPEWAKEAIWYQIFPERFRNGDPSNDPRPKDMLETYPGFVPAGWKPTPWSHDWYKDDPWFKNSNLPDKRNNYQLRRYGGDLQGVLDKLDYLDDLGITAIYFNPLNDSPSLHKYDPRHWRHIDRNFGPDPEGDQKTISEEVPHKPETWQFTSADSLFLKVLKACKKRNIRVILDYSFNHVGKDFWTINDIHKKGKNSKYADWFAIEEFDDPATETDEFKYHGWAGIIWMPEVNKTITSNPEEIPFEGNLTSEELKQHIYAVAKRWLDPNGDGNPEDGVDGFRLDVAAEVPKGFWRDFRKEVRQINPEAYLVGEIWWKSWPDELMFPHQFLQGDMFDAIMNYRWYRPARHFFADAPEAMPVSEFVNQLKDKLRDIEPQRLQAMMNLVASHDAPRVATSLYNPGKYKYNAKPEDDASYKIDKPGATTRKIQKMLLIHQFTFVGAPHIYYGDEVGMWGADDPDCRKPMIWQDIDYEAETHHLLDKERKTDSVQQDIELKQFYKTLINIRKNNPALTFGEIEFLLADDENRLLAYARNYKDQTIIAVFNKSEKVQTVVIPRENEQTFTDALTKNAIISDKNGLSINLEANTASILISEK
jgi:glycosidase